MPSDHPHELLRTIVGEAPESFRETIRVDRLDVRPVHRNLGELEALHLIELVEEDRRNGPMSRTTGSNWTSRSMGPSAPRIRPLPVRGDSPPYNLDGP